MANDTYWLDLFKYTWAGLVYLGLLWLGLKALLRYISEVRELGWRKPFFLRRECWWGHSKRRKYSFDDILARVAGFGCAFGYVLAVVPLDLPTSTFFDNWLISMPTVSYVLFGISLTSYLWLRVRRRRSRKIRAGD